MSVCLFTKTHEWLRKTDDGMAVIGISDFAQAALGELVYVELPEIGDSVAQGDECATVESVKSASDIYAPVAGEIVAVNDALVDAPELVNQAPYENGWLFQIKITDADQLTALLSEADYQAQLPSEE